MKQRLYSMLLTTACIFAGCGASDAPKASPAAPTAPAPSESAPKAEAPKPTIDLATLALKVDPVCRMSLEEYPATATAEHGGKTYGFCSDFCKKKFVESPEAMLARVSNAKAAPQ